MYILLFPFQRTHTNNASASTTPTKSTPMATTTNIVTNGDFESGTSPWEVAYHPTYGASNLVSDGSIVTPYAESGTHAYQIHESGLSDSGNRSLCIQQSFYHPHTATYQLSFYYGRQSNPASGSTTTNDQIDMWLYVDGNQIVVLSVCNPSLGECSVQLPSSAGSQGGYDVFSGQLQAPEGNHTVKICAVYSSTKRGTQDYFLVDNVDAHQVL